MFAYRERRLRALVIAGAAEVQFLTAGKIKVQGRPRDERGGRVCDCPTGALKAQMRSRLMPVSIPTPETKNPGNAVPIATWALRQGNPLKR
jgi:hypothetical protein